MNQDLRKWQFYRPSVGTITNPSFPTVNPEEEVPFFFEHGVMNWSLINVQNNRPDPAKMVSNLMYLTPQTIKGEDIDNREGNSINWRYSTVKFRMHLGPEGKGSTTFPWRPWAVRFVIFKFNGLRGQPIYFQGASAEKRNYPRQADLWERIYELSKDTNHVLVDHSFRGNCAQLTKRTTGGPSPCKIVVDKTVYMHYDENRRYEKTVKLTLNHKAGVKVNYASESSQGPSGETAEYPTQSPLNEHYFVAVYAQQPIRVLTAQNFGASTGQANADNQFSARVPHVSMLGGSGSSNSDPLEMRVVTHMTVSHKFDA